MAILSFNWVLHPQILHLPVLAKDSPAQCSHLLHSSILRLNISDPATGAPSKAQWVTDLDRDRAFSHIDELATIFLTTASLAKFTFGRSILRKLS